MLCRKQEKEDCWRWWHTNIFEFKMVHWRQLEARSQDHHTPIKSDSPHPDNNNTELCPTCLTQKALNNPCNQEGCQRVEGQEDSASSSSLLDTSGEEAQLLSEHTPLLVEDSASAARMLGSHPPLSSSASQDDHCHLSHPGQEHSEERRRISKRKFMVAIGLTFVFMCCEFIGGYLSNSLAVTSDAAHMCSDLANFVIGLGAITLADKGVGHKFNYGYRRMEALGALMCCLIIWILTAVLFYFAIQRMITHDYEVEGTAMIVVAVVAVLFNIVLYLVFKKMGGHGHSHGLSGGGVFEHSHLQEEEEDGHGGHGHSHGRGKSKKLYCSLQENLFHVSLFMMWVVFRLATFLA